VSVTDHTLARADEVLTELIELVETARTMPMSSSCVVPRERTLDLLDALREVLPPEMAQARQIVATRDRMLSEAGERATESVRAATEEGEALVAQARVHAHQLVEAGQAEQARLVSSASVHQRATEDAAALRAEAEHYSAEVRREAEQYAELTRANAEQHAQRLTSDAHNYAETTLAELVENLHRLLGTAENGRAALARRVQAPSQEFGEDFSAEEGLR